MYYAYTSFLPGHGITLLLKALIDAGILGVGLIVESNKPEDYKDLIQSAKKLEWKVKRVSE